MIARIWRGYTTRENADIYESMLTPELLPGLSGKAGFRGSYLLRRTVGDEIEFVTIILFDCLEDVRALAGERYEEAVVPIERRRVLTRWDLVATHYDVASSR